MIALLAGRFHALTQGQAQWISQLAGRPEIDRIAVAVTSADHAGTRRNPLDAGLREQLLTPPLAATGKRFDLVRVSDVPNSDRWVEHLASTVSAAIGASVSPETTRVFTANRDVDRLFEARGFTVVSQEVQGITPHELVKLAAEGLDWKAHAARSTVEVYERHRVPERLARIYAQTLLTDDGELGHARDFASYGTQMDAALAQKLEDLLPWIVAGRIVDKGCGTGSLLVELARRFPEGALIGVDLSREFLRRCDENHYACEDVTFVQANIAERQVEPGTATTVIFSSVVHEIYSYSGYDRDEVRRALANARDELASGGRVLIRDGVSAGTDTWRLGLLDEATRTQFERFAREFKHGQGAPHERLSRDEVLLSAHLANEFLCKKDYLTNWHIEVHEEYGTFTADEWSTELRAAGLVPLHVRAYVNPWIAEHRYRGHVALWDSHGAPLGWPATNVVVVGERR